MKHFKPEQRKHWPIMQAYREKKISYKQAAAQLKDLGAEKWEIELYLDRDQNAEPE